MLKISPRQFSDVESIRSLPNHQASQSSFQRLEQKKMIGLDAVRGKWTYDAIEVTIEGKGVTLQDQWLLLV